MTDFFPTDLENAAFDAWKQQVLDATAHGWLPSDAYLLKAFTEGDLSVDKVALDADWDYEEVVAEREHDEAIEWMAEVAWDEHLSEHRVL